MKGTIKLEIAQKYSNFGARSEKTGKLLPAYQDCTETWTPPISKRTGNLITGLTDEQEKFYESKLGFDDGHLKKSSKYWDSFKVKVPSEGVILDLEDYMSQLKYLVLKSDPLVASDKLTMENNPYCEFVMIRDEEKAENESKERNVKIQSYGILSKLTSQDYQDVFLMIKNSDPTDIHLSIVKNEVEKYVETMPKQFIELFTEGSFKDKVVLTRLIKKGVISKKGRGLNSPLYFNDTFLGNNVEECMSFLKEPTNNVVFIDIMKRNQSFKKDNSKFSLSEEVNSFESKEEEKQDTLTENEKLQLKIDALSSELKKQKEETKSLKTQEIDASKIERNDEGFSKDSSDVSNTIEEVETEVVEAPKTRTRTTKKTK